MVLDDMSDDIACGRTHVHLQQLMKEVDTDNSGTIDYSEFLIMMLGPKSSVLRMYATQIN